MNKSSELEIFKLKQKFPLDKWEQRGLIPSASDVISEMEDTINRFVDFFKENIEMERSDLEELNQLIRTYVLNEVYYSLKFDTEEREFIYDTMNEVLNLYSLNIYPILDS